MAGHVIYRNKESAKRALEFGEIFYLHDGTKIEYESYQVYIGKKMKKKKAKALKQSPKTPESKFPRISPKLSQVEIAKNSLLSPISKSPTLTTTTYTSSTAKAIGKTRIEDVSRNPIFDKNSTLLIPNNLDEMLDLLSAFQPLPGGSNCLMKHPYPLGMDERAEVNFENQILEINKLVTPPSREVFKDTKEPLRSLLAGTFEEVTRSHVSQSNVTFRFTLNVGIQARS